MRVMAYNIFACRDHPHRRATGQIRFDCEPVARVIRAEQVDFVGLNEVRGEGTKLNFIDQTGTLSQLTGLQHRFFGMDIRVMGQRGSA